MVDVPRQGDILLLNTAPRSGHEQTGRRPYIVLSHDTSNVVIVAPITTTSRNYPLYIEITENHKMKTRGKVMLDQITTIDYEARNCKFLEKASEKLIEELLTKIRAVFQKV